MIRFPMQSHSSTSVAIACLLIAAKYEEPEILIPQPSVLVSLSSSSTQVPRVHAAEIDILAALQWNVAEIVPLHFIGYYLAQGVLFADDTVKRGPLNERVPKHMSRFSVFFSELAMQEYQFQQYPASIVASAIIAASRRALQIR